MIKFYPELGFVAIVKAKDFMMEFEVHDSDETDEAKFLAKHNSSHALLDGWIKETGSMWWRFVGGEYQGPWGLDSVDDLIKLFAELHKEAAILLPGWHEKPETNADPKGHPWPTNDNVYWIAGYPPCRLVSREGPVVVLERPDGNQITVTSAKFANMWHPA